MTNASFNSAVPIHATIAALAKQILFAGLFVCLLSQSLIAQTVADPPAKPATANTNETDPAADASDASKNDTASKATTDTVDAAKDVDQSQTDDKFAQKPKEEARRKYLGRVVAKPMSHLGAQWLIRPDRDKEEQATVSFKQLNLTKGMTVCDLGCGNGYWTLPMAKAVGIDGRVLAVDIQPEMLEKLRANAGRANLKNVEPVLGTVDNPKIPVGEVDLLLMVDVYHEFSHPQSMLWEIRRSLTPTGVVALLEYREEDPSVPIKPLHKMSKKQIMKEYSANGFKLVREYNKLPWQHLMFFARDDSPLEAIEPVPAQQVLKDLQ